MKIAVIGAGISGIGAAVILGKEHEVHLFESENRLGGHAHTVAINQSGEVPILADTGFLVYNELTYPNLIAFFEMLGVETVPSDMSLSVQVQDKGLEWSGTNLNTVFAQRKNLLRPSFLKMLTQILRFNREAEQNLVLAKRHAWTLGELLTSRRFGRHFRDYYLLPIGAAIWSTPEDSMLKFPAATFLTFFLNHKLLQVNDQPKWRTVKNGSIQYVEKAAKLIPHIHLGKAIQQVERTQKGVQVKLDDGVMLFDRVVMATHAPITAKLLMNPSELERRVLSPFQTIANTTILHRDASLMPKSEKCWAAWNVQAANAGKEKVSLTYYLNRLQPLATKQNYFVTLNPIQTIENVIRKLIYHHPLFDQDTIRAQRELSEIQGGGGVYYAGAWTRYGFHEDGLLSAVKVAKHMGILIPWKV